MRQEKVKAFWKWFSENAARLWHFEDDQIRLSNELQQELRHIHQPKGYSGRGPSLTFDMNQKQGGIRELFISADAIPSAFHLASELVAASPALPGWRIKALIPRQHLGTMLLEWGFKAEDIWFRLRPEPERQHLTLFTRHRPPAYEENISEVRAFLIHVLGEECFATRIASFDCLELPPDPESWGLKPLRELPDEVDRSSTPVNVESA
ncbi:MAG TPA: hypothetical protein VGP72_26555 [Planctomycetota bacterium]|jgi:hypothetical protein